MSRKEIRPYPANFNDTPYSHLQPIVDALVRGGNETIGDALFRQDRDGWRCDLKRPIDFELLKELFDFPETITLSEQLDKIFCRNTWTEIKGSVGQ